jgi:hypothetical protein
MRYQPTAVYLIYNTWSNANYKVGKTSNIPRRIAEIEDQYEVDARLIASCWFPTKMAAEAAERTWHKILSHFSTDDHRGREWFSLPSAQIEQFNNWAALSIPKPQLTKWLFGQSPSTDEVRRFQDMLFKAMPKRINQPSVDVWNNPNYLLNFMYNTTFNEPRPRVSHRVGLC